MRIAEPTHAEGTITTIGEKYRVVQILGVGGMGTVYEAENQWTGRRVAIKLLRPELIATPTIVQRFNQEAQAAAKIRHDHIVDVLDMGRDAETGSFFIVQELLEGEDLGAWLRTHRRMTPREAFELLIPVMGALAAAHDEGIVHRDIKPENIFLARSKSGSITPKLIDFGISKLSDANGAVKMTHTGMAIGTPEYMSPEQARGDESLDARTDIWSLGIVLYEIISGSVPYEDKNYNLVVSRVLTEPVDPITSREPGIAPSVAAIVHRALERDRDARYPNIRSMLRDVLACAELGIADAAHAISRFGTSLHDADRETDSPAAPAQPAPSPVVTLDDGAAIERSIPSPGTRPPARPRVAAFVAAAVLTVGVFAAAAAPRTPREAAHSFHASLSPLATHVARPTVAPRVVDAVSAPTRALAEAAPVALAMPRVATNSAPPPRRNINVALAPNSPSHVRSIAFDVALRASSSTREPAEVIPMRAVAPTSVVHRHHIVVE